MVKSNRAVWLALAVLLAGALTVGVGAVAFSDDAPQESHSGRDVQLIETDNETALWPYTGRERAFSSKTLSINVVVYGDADDVRRALLTRTDADWNETTEEEADLDSDAEPVAAQPNGTSIRWESARGATRYTYVANAAPDGQSRAGYWTAESAQLHDGDYLGTRYHVRLYEPLGDDPGWVAIQAHQEHWDWFGLRHSVDSNERAQQYVESDFMDQPFVRSVSREYYDTSDPLDTDGWVTVIELREEAVGAPEGATEGGTGALGNETVQTVVRAGPGAGAGPAGLVLAGLLAGLLGLLASTNDPAVSRSTLERHLSRTRAHFDHLAGAADLRYLVLFGATLSALLFVRATGIYLEEALTVRPKLLVALLYPLIPLGVPLCAYFPARSLDELRSFVVASAGIALGITTDYAMLGVGVLPVETLVHRLGVVLAVGLIAAGAAESTPGGRANQTLRLGALLWVAVVLAPLARWL